MKTSADTAHDLNTGLWAVWKCHSAAGGCCICHRAWEPGHHEVMRKVLMIPRVGKLIIASSE